MMKTLQKTKSIKLKVKELSKSFGKKTVLNKLDLDLHKGESLVVIGGSGTGKSVMLKCILGLMNADSGSVLVDDQEILKMNQSEREKLMHKFGMLFQGAALFDSINVWENIAFGLIQGQNINKRKAREIAFEKLTAVGLSADVGNLYHSELSGGMQKRVALARAIATEPEIIFFDEPTTGLDPIMADVINELIIKITKESGTTTLSITHDMASARKIADRIAMIYKGQIIWHGSVDNLKNSNNEYVDQFVNGRAEGPIQTLTNNN